MRTNFVRRLLFQSTLPVKGATSVNQLTAAGMKFQSTLPVKGATSFSVSTAPSVHVSIHAPSEGSDMGVYQEPI